MRKKFNISIFLLLTSLLLFSSCRSHKKTVIDHDRKPEVDVYEPTINSKLKPLIIEAQTWLGTPYKYAHAEKGEGTDCSGMVMQIFLKVYNIKLPRSSREQAEFCIKIDKNDAITGDLVFFATGSDSCKISHVGIMMDKERFIHASSSKGVVISCLTNNYYAKHFIKFGRVPI